MASGGQAVNHLKEEYSGLVPDIWDHGYVIVEFKNNTRAMLELCMFAEGAKYQEEISVTGQLVKLRLLFQDLQGLAEKTWCSSISK